MNPIRLVLLDKDCFYRGLSPAQCGLTLQSHSAFLFPSLFFDRKPWWSHNEQRPTNGPGLLYQAIDRIDLKDFAEMSERKPSNQNDHSFRKKESPCIITSINSRPGQLVKQSIFGTLAALVICTIDTLRTKLFPYWARSVNVSRTLVNKTPCN